MKKASSYSLSLRRKQLPQLNLQSRQPSPPSLGPRASHQRQQAPSPPRHKPPLRKRPRQPNNTKEVRRLIVNYSSDQPTLAWPIRDLGLAKRVSRKSSARERFPRPESFVRKKAVVQQQQGRRWSSPLRQR